MSIERERQRDAELQRMVGRARLAAAAAVGALLLAYVLIALFGAP